MDNILFSIEDYFQAKGVEDDMSRLGMISSDLQDMALLWWRRKRDNQIGEPVRTWDEFTVEFHKQFYLEYAENEASENLC